MVPNRCSLQPLPKCRRHRRRRPPLLQHPIKNYRIDGSRGNERGGGVWQSWLGPVSHEIPGPCEWSFSWVLMRWGLRVRTQTPLRAHCADCPVARPVSSGPGCTFVFALFLSRLGQVCCSEPVFLLFLHLTLFR